MSDYANPTMFLIFPGMTSFEEVEIIGPAADAGFVYVRPFGSDDELKVNTARLVTRETAQARTSVKTITEVKSDWVNGSWISTTTTKTVRHI